MTTLTARSPEDLLAVVPVVLGFEPADSIVMLTLDARQTFHARVDLPPDRRGVAEVVDLLLEPAARHRARSAVLLLYTADDQLARAVVRRFRRGGPAGRGPVLVEALRVDGGRWFPLLGAPGGRAHDRGALRRLQPPRSSPRRSWSGRVLHGSPDRARRPRSVPTPLAVAEVERPARRGAGVGGTGWRRGWREWVGRDGQPPTDVAARLLVSLAAPAGP